MGTHAAQELFLLFDYFLLSLGIDLESNALDKVSIDD